MPIRKGEDPATWSATDIPRVLFLSSKEKMFLAKYLAVMLKAGIPLDKSLLAIDNQATSASLHKILHVVMTDVQSGEFLSTSLKKFPRQFDSLFVNMVTVGEESGTLSDALSRLAAHIEKVRALRAKIRGATLYPLIVVAGTLATAAYLVLVLLPQLVPLFLSLNIELPWTTRLVLGSSMFLTEQWPLVLAGLAVLAGAAAILLRVQKTRYAVDFLLLKFRCSDRSSPKSRWRSSRVSSAPCSSPASPSSRR